MRELTLHSRTFNWLGPVLVGSGGLLVALILFSPASERGPISWWLVTEALSFRHVLPLVGLGAALALLPWRAGAIAFFAFSLGIVFGGLGIEALIATVVQIPGGAKYQFLFSLVSPVAFLASGVALVSPARMSPYLAPLAALVVGAAFASFIRLTYPIFSDPDVVKAGILFGLWLMVAVALSLRAFHQSWFAIAGPIVGSWFVGIALIDGGHSILVLTRNVS